jgi:hypothetical protein
MRLIRVRAEPLLPILLVVLVVALELLDVAIALDRPVPSEIPGRPGLLARDLKSSRS